MVTHLLGHAVFCLLLHPEPIERLHQDPAPIYSTIEEALHYLPSVWRVTRMTTDEVVLGGQRIPAQAHICAWIVSANRDESRFSSPDTFFVDVCFLMSFKVLCIKGEILQVSKLDIPLFMFTNEFYRPYSIDFAPQGSRCEWCGALAESQITAIGGAMHNHGGLFCRSCGKRFCALVANAAHTVPRKKSEQLSSKKS